MDGFYLPPKPAIIIPQAARVIRPGDPKFMPSVEQAMLGGIGINAFSGGAGGSTGRPFAGVSAASVTQGVGNSGSNGFTYRTVLAPGAISNYGDFCKIVFQSGSGGAATITKAYIDLLSSTYGFASESPKQILFSGSASIAIGAANTEGASDVLTFPIDQSQSYVISHYYAGVPAQAATSSTSLPTGWTQYYKSGDEAGTTGVVSGYTANTVINSVKRIEV